jgi:predicted nucleic acid-binding protein
LTRIVLDSEAFNALAGPDTTPRNQEVRRVLRAATAAGGEVMVPTVVLAELYRPGRLAMVDACLAQRSFAPECRDTDRSIARLVGGVLAAADAGSEDIVDAHVVAVAAEGGRSAVLTGDPDDIERLAAPYPLVAVIRLP